MTNPTDEHACASAQSWILVRPDGTIVAAFSDIQDATDELESDSSLALKKAPDFLSEQDFVWGVISSENALDSLHGGHADAATARAQAIGGELKLFVAPRDLPSSPTGQ
ncbi:MAG: hypothetical protein ABR548_03920 [Actinomycetota bacterium]|nr:hypothetical protein [Actinomycetota bacterium]